MPGDLYLTRFRVKNVCPCSIYQNNPFAFLGHLFGGEPTVTKCTAGLCPRQLTATKPDVTLMQSRDRTLSAKSVRIYIISRIFENNGQKKIIEENSTLVYRRDGKVLERKSGRGAQTTVPSVSPFLQTRMGLPGGD